MDAGPARARKRTSIFRTSTRQTACSVTVTRTSSPIALTRCSTRSGEGVERTLDVAARLGLESAGIVIPIAVPADAVTKPDAEPTMVLIGTTHPIVERLIKEGKLQQPSLQPGEGLIQVVRKAFGEKGVVIVTGGDAAGLARALEQLAERFPHIWARGKDRTTIDDVEEQIRRFVSNRSPEGQAAAALYAIDRIGRELEGKQLEQATVSVHVDKADPGLRDFVRQAAANRLKAGQIEVVVDNRDVQKAGAIFEDDFTVASEVKQFWDLFETRVLPAPCVEGSPSPSKRGSANHPRCARALPARPPTSSFAPARAARARASSCCPPTSRGTAGCTTVVRPALAGKAIESITIRFAEIGPPPEWKQQAMFAPTRWLLEIFPIDEILARELKIDLSRFGSRRRRSDPRPTR